MRADSERAARLPRIAMPPAPRAPTPRPPLAMRGAARAKWARSAPVGAPKRPLTELMSTTGPRVGGTADTTTG